MTRSGKLWLVAAVLFLALVAVQLWIIVSNESPYAGTGSVRSASSRGSTAGCSAVGSAS